MGCERISWVCYNACYLLCLSNGIFSIKVWEKPYFSISKQTSTLHSIIIAHKLGQLTIDHAFAHISKAMECNISQSIHPFLGGYGLLFYLQTRNCRCI